MNREKFLLPSQKLSEIVCKLVKFFETYLEKEVSRSKWGLNNLKEVFHLLMMDLDNNLKNYFNITNKQWQKSRLVNDIHFENFYWSLGKGEVWTFSIKSIKKIKKLKEQNRRNNRELQCVGMLMDPRHCLIAWNMHFLWSTLIWFRELNQVLSNNCIYLYFQTINQSLIFK